MRSILIVVGFFCCLAANAQISIDQSPVIDHQPVSRKEWSVFFQFVKSDPTFSKKYYQSLIPNQWGKQQSSSNLQDMPVTGVSWQQAQDYCEWRSIVSTYLNTHSRAGTYQEMRAANISAKTLITYRLPTEQEWLKFASHSANKTIKGIGVHCIHSVKYTI